MSKVDVAVTGATGFVGKHLIERLNLKGLKARLLVRKPGDHDLGDAEIVQGDLSQGPALAELCDGAPCVLHCAGLISATSAERFADVNVEGTRNIVAEAQKAGVKRFVYLSSLAARKPDISHYAATKRGGEDLVRQAGDAFHWTILRPAAVYGPGDWATLPLLRQLLRPVAFIPGSRAARVSLIHARDLADALVKLASGENVAGDVFELDDGRPDGYSWEEMAEIAGRLQGRRIRCVFLPKAALRIVGRVEVRFAKWGDRMPELTPEKVSELYFEDWVCRNNLLRDHSGWSAQIGFEQGFEETVAWYRDAGWI